jgi:hypothetical protein
VRGAVRSSGADRHPRRGGQLGVGELGRDADTFGHAHRPRRAVALPEENGHDLAVDELTDPTDGRLEDLVEVERRRQALSHAVQ